MPRKPGKPGTQGGRTSKERPGPELQFPSLVSSSSKAIDGPTGSAEELDKVFQKTC